MKIQAVRKSISTGKLLSYNDVNMGAYQALLDAFHWNYPVMVEKRNTQLPTRLASKPVGESATFGKCWWDENAKALVFTK